MFHISSTYLYLPLCTLSEAVFYEKAFELAWLTSCSLLLSWEILLQNISVLKYSYILLLIIKYMKYTCMYYCSHLTIPSFAWVCRLYCIYGEWCQNLSVIEKHLSMILVWRYYYGHFKNDKENINIYWNKFQFTPNKVQQHIIFSGNL